MLKLLRSDPKQQVASRQIIENQRYTTKSPSKIKSKPNQVRNGSEGPTNNHRKLPSIHKSNSSSQMLCRNQTLLHHSKEKYIPIKLASKLQFVESLRKQNSIQRLKLPALQKSPSKLISSYKPKANMLKIEAGEKQFQDKGRKEIKTEVSEGEGKLTHRIALDRYASEHMQFLNRLERVVVYTRMSNGVGSIPFGKI